MKNYLYLSDPYKRYGSPKKKPDDNLLILLFFLIILLILSNLN